MASADDDRAIIEKLGYANLQRSERAVRRRNFRIALFFMAPAVLLTSIVLLLPIAFNIYLSFTRWERFKGLDQFGGLDNYQLLLNHPQFETAFTSTVVWVTASLIIPVGLGLVLALMLRGIPMEGTFKNIIFLPRVLAPTSIGVIWFYVYAPHGVLNSVLSLISGHPVDTGWLYTDQTTMPSIIATYVWQNVGLVMVLLLLGLAAIPTDPIEAARMDGASNRQVLQYIVLPLLTPTLLVVSMLSILAGFGAFDLLWVMGISYPGQRTLSLSVYMYFVGFNKGSWAYAAAIAVFLGAISIAVTWVQALLQARAERLRG
ncbi:permease [Labrys miyagiensis]|uniref:Permease n=1 Tax=Labrys miyagiensis TaxID=346912 RepID=A0ABQ6CIC6_9HYPH|nr:sugar ABC transporter permease [Labrys miyagiensis]GLS19981.1 permease [Labrys miyagiensis]